MSRSVQMGPILLFFVHWLAPLSASAQPPAADKQLPLKHPALTDLGKLYLDLELPVPSKDVGFAILGTGLPPWQFERYGNPADGLGPLKSDYWFQFATEDPNIKGQYRVWVGFRVNSHKRVEQFQRTAPSPSVVLQVMKMDRLRSIFSYPAACDEELIFAIQCHLLGHSELATFFYRRCRKMAQEPLDQTFLIEAWNHWARIK